MPQYNKISVELAPILPYRFDDKEGVGRAAYLHSRHQNMEILKSFFLLVYQGKYLFEI